MPLTRYQIRSEFGLADPELYRTADKDDPEALLEGVAMAGLVGVLRQLGDLAEFAAEIFHDLHEEVMSTAARGHWLMARVQQLEAEFPSIEKAILSQTNHSSFFTTNAGTDWHPNLRMEQNLITNGDLPRFVMDSYEECRGPPRLFLLDKFDVAGAGACLKRYTDPSLFRVEAASNGISSVEVQREKKTRKVKKKGSRWRNGETPDALPASHAKLHDLFLEERAENAHPDPARLVKLKRRPVNASSFDLKPGKSYMEKFLDPDLPEQKIVCEVPANQSPLRLTYDNSDDSGLEILENSLQSKDFTCLSPRKQEVVIKPSSLDLNGQAKGNMGVPDPYANGKMEESISVTHKMASEEGLGVDAHDITDESLDGDNSDDITSEIDNYMDALTTVDSEIETDNEYKNKNDQGFLNVRKHGKDNAANEEVQDVQANFSDSQSIESSSVSDGGNSSSKKGASSFSGSDSISNLADNTPSDGEGTATKFHCTKDFTAEAADLPSELPSLRSGTDSRELTDVGKILDSDQASYNSSLKDLNPMPSAPAAICHKDPAPELDETPSVGIELSSKLPSDDTNGTNPADPSALISDVPSLISHGTSFAVPSNNGPGVDSDHENPSTSYVLHMSDMSEIIPEDKGGDNSVNKMSLTDSADENCTETLVEGKQAPHFAPEVEVDSIVTLLPNSSDALRPDDLVSGVVAAAAAAVVTMTVDSESLTPTVNTSEVTTMEERINPEICVFSDGEEMVGLTRAVDLMGGSAVSQDPEDHVNLDNLVTEFSQAGNEVISPTVLGPDGEAGSDVFFPSSDIVSSPSRTLTSVQETDEMVSPECLSESLKQIEMKQSEDAPADIVISRPYESLPEDLSDIEATEPIGDSPLLEQTQNSIYVQDITSEPVSEPRNQDLGLKPTHQSISKEAVDDAACSTYLSEAGVSSEHSAKSQAEEFRIDDVHGNEETSDLLNIHTLPASHLAEPAISFGHSFELQSDQNTEGCVRDYEEHSGAFSLQSNQIESHAHKDQEPHLDTYFAKGMEDIPGHEPVVQSASQNSSCAELVMDPFDSIFPTFGLQSEETHANMDAMPPLPPLPPMQWRIGKVQPCPPASQSEWIDHNQGASASLKPTTTDEAQFDFPLSNGVVGRGSSPFSSLVVTDSQRLEHSSTELLENSSQPSTQSLGMVTTNMDVRNTSDCRLMEGTESLSSSSILPDTPTEEPAHGLVGIGELVHSNSSTSSSIPAIECTPAGCNPAPSQDTPIQPFNHVPLEAYSDVKGAELGAQNSGREQGDSPDESVAQVSSVEEQRPHHDLSVSQGETIWLPSTFGLPPNYEAGKLNGNKLPRPRNPLSDAVAAHDKSTLRKVAEHIRPQIGPKVEERDSLLEQIRAKSFSLKPAATTRPSIQAIPGPKTNLRVAAILEKANAIRQALAGSDEDDSDSWSDS